MNKLLSSMLVLVLLMLISACRPPEIEGTVLNIKNELYDEAFASAQSAVEKYPQNAEAWFYWGWLNGEHKKNYEVMNEAFNEALKLNPAQKVNYSGQSLTVNEAVNDFRQKKYVDYYRSAIDDFNNAMQNEDLEKKKDLFTKANEKLILAGKVDPSRTEYISPLARTYLFFEDTAKAEIVLLEGLEKQPDNKRLTIAAGEIYLMSGNTAKAEELFKKSLNMTSKDTTINESHIYISLGNIESNRGNWKEANEYYQKAIKLDPDNSILSFNIGVSLLQQKQFKEAIPFFNKSLESDPDNKETHDAVMICYNNVVSQMPSENLSEDDKAFLDDGITFLKNMIEKNSNDKDLWINLGVYYGKKGMAEESEAAFKKAKELEE